MEVARPAINLNLQHSGVMNASGKRNKRAASKALSDFPAEKKGSLPGNTRAPEHSDVRAQTQCLPSLLSMINAKIIFACAKESD